MHTADVAHAVKSNSRTSQKDGPSIVYFTGPEIMYNETKL